MYAFLCSSNKKCEESENVLNNNGIFIDVSLVTIFFYHFDTFVMLLIGLRPVKGR